MTKQERAACSKILLLLREYEALEEESYDREEDEKAEMYREFIDDLKDVFNLYTGYVSSSLLTDEERKYLKKIIKPFRDNVKSIWKRPYRDGEFIGIVYTDTVDGRVDSIDLPCFRFGKFFSGLKENKKYTIEELGL